jgi:hypothetical protein
MIDWPLALSTVSQSIKFANDLRKIDKEINEADLKLKIAELTSTLADLKIILTEAKTDAAEKDAEIERLKVFNRRVAEETIEVAGYRYRNGGDEPAGMPFCNVCLQKEGLLIETTATFTPGRPCQCPNCKALYGDVLTFSG